MKVILELGIVSEWELRYAVGQVFSVKNRQLRSAGWSPMQATQGSDALLPSALIDQMVKNEIKLNVCHRDQEPDLQANGADPHLGTGSIRVDGFARPLADGSGEP
jgi:hypothetical protein